APSIGPNPTHPRRNGPPAVKAPGANCNVKRVWSGLTVKVISEAETPFAVPTWKRFGFKLNTKPVGVVSNDTVDTDLLVDGCTASPKKSCQGVQSPCAEKVIGPTDAVAVCRLSGSGIAVAVVCSAE